MPSLATIGPADYSPTDHIMKRIAQLCEDFNRINRMCVAPEDPREKDGDFQFRIDTKARIFELCDVLRNSAPRDQRGRIAKQISNIMMSVNDKMMKQELEKLWKEMYQSLPKAVQMALTEGDQL